MEGIIIDERGPWERGSMIPVSEQGYMSRVNKVKVENLSMCGSGRQLRMTAW